MLEFCHEANNALQCVEENLTRLKDTAFSCERIDDRSRVLVADVRKYVIALEEALKASVECLAREVRGLRAQKCAPPQLPGARSPVPPRPPPARYGRQPPAPRGAEHRRSGPALLPPREESARDGEDPGGGGWSDAQRQPQPRQQPQQQQQQRTARAEQPQPAEPVDIVRRGFCKLPADQSLACSAYVVLEALAFRVAAERATIFKHLPAADGEGDGVLQAIALVNSGHIQPKQVRVDASQGVAGTAFISGIALNICSAYADLSFVSRVDADTSFRTKSMLCFPIFGITGSRPIGVVQLINKQRGSGTKFSTDDEALVFRACQVLAYILSRYPCDLSRVTFDPAMLHRLVPLSDTKGCKMDSAIAADLGQDLPKSFRTDLAEFVPQQLVFRTSHSGQQLKHSAVVAGDAVQGSANIVEVDEYMKNLEECWKKTADDCVVMEQVHSYTRDEFRKKKKRLKLVEDKLHATKREVDQYRTAYQMVKTELARVMSPRRDRQSSVESRSTTPPQPQQEEKAKEDLSESDDEGLGLEFARKLRMVALRHYADGGKGDGQESSNSSADTVPRLPPISAGHPA
eukprot:TRINITY_DN7071_c4_g2_i1.p1 TRINITY_DN7071_c4_g2~~TRINITY_DN7071_c4_g2_i1.p1  ORF type:complete len:575 (+),score=196.94 TRINITY_DN7071_c4_g2_i1:91-1815(+)